MLLKQDCGATRRSDQIRSFLGSPAPWLHGELCLRVLMVGWPLGVLALWPSWWCGLLLATGQVKAGPVFKVLAPALCPASCTPRSHSSHGITGMIPAVDHRADPTMSPLCRTEGAGAEGHLCGWLLYSRMRASCAGGDNTIQHSQSPTASWWVCVCPHQGEECPQLQWCAQQVPTLWLQCTVCLKATNPTTWVLSQ